MPSAEEFTKAKAQARRVVSVDSKRCRMHVGAISYFRRDELKFHWRDPEPDEPERFEPIELRLPEDAWRYYYEPVLALAMVDGADDRAVLDIDVRIHQEVLELLLEGAWAAGRIRAMELARTLRDEGYQQDGVRVEAGPSWSTARDRFSRDA